MSDEQTAFIITGNISTDAAIAEILRLRAENEKLRAENERTYMSIYDEAVETIDFTITDTLGKRRKYIEELEAQVEKLRAALKPFKEELEAQIEEVPHITDDEELIHCYTLRLGDLRAAAAALKETGE